MPLPSVLKWFQFHLLPFSCTSCRGAQTDIFIPSVAEVNKWSCTTTATICLHDMERGNFTLFRNGYFLSTGHFSILWGLLHLMFMKLICWCVLSSRRLVSQSLQEMYCHLNFLWVVNDLIKSLHSFSGLSTIPRYSDFCVCFPSLLFSSVSVPECHLPGIWPGLLSSHWTLNNLLCRLYYSLLLCRSSCGSG